MLSLATTRRSRVPEPDEGNVERPDGSQQIGRAGQLPPPHRLLIPVREPPL